MTSLLKICPKCQIPKNRANFAMGYCKKCDAERHRDKRAEDGRKCRQCKDVKKPDQYNDAASRSCKACVQATIDRRNNRVKLNYAQKKEAENKACPLMNAFLRSKI